MKKRIDCLLIGHNEINIKEYERIVKGMGENSGAYRDFKLNYVFYNNSPYTPMGIYNLLRDSKEEESPLIFGETFSAAIAYLGSYLHKNGLTFEYINSFQDEKIKLAEILKQDNIVTVAIVTTLYVTALPIIEIIDFIKQYNKEVKIVVGGPFIATQVRTQDKASFEYLCQNTLQADFFINSSQGESTLVKLIDTLKTNSSVDQVENLYYKTDTQINRTSILKEENRLSENPVDWDLFTNRTGHHVNLRTAISCPFSCAFCGFPQHAGKHQVLDVNGIERELNKLDRVGQVKSINFIDDTFNVPLKRYKEILRMMIKNRYTFKWHSYFRCQFADREMVEMMQESGCEGVFLGIESGSKEVLKNMNKASQLEQYLHGIDLLKEYQITTFGSFIIGFPGETEETVEDTIKFIKESGIDFYRAQLWYGEPITPIWKEREKYKIVGESFEWSHATMNSKTACNLIDKIFMSIEDPIWIPQYNFDFDSLWHLVHRGINLESVKNFLRAFNQGIKEKFNTHDRQEISFEILKRIMSIFQPGKEFNDSVEKRDEIIDKYGAGFDF